MKSMLFVFFMCIASFSAAQNVAGQPSLKVTYQEETQQVLNQLEALGVTQIACKANRQGCLHPRDLRSALNTIKFEELKEFTKDSASTRWGAFYDPKGKVVYLNTAAKHDSQLIGFLGLHELLGALGRPESEFDISMSAYHLIDLRKRDPNANVGHLKHLIALTPLRFPNKVSEANTSMVLQGGVIVGGCGDTRVFALRAQIYEKLKEYVTDPIYLAAYFMDKPIEISNLDIAEPHYEIFEATLIDQILVPAEWLTQKSVRDPATSAAVADVVWFLRSMYPKVSGFKTFRYCGMDTPENQKELHPQAIKKVWGPRLRDCARLGYRQ